MKRKSFLKSIVLTTGFSMVNPSGILDLLEPSKDVILPFPRGLKRKITILKSKIGFFNGISAQYQIPYSYHQGYNYNNLAQYQQMYAYQQAAAQWNNYYRQQQQYYTWLQAEHIRQMQYILQHYSSYQQIGDPNIWGHVTSMYAFARNQGYQPVLFGLNSSKDEVAIKDTLKGAANVFDEVNDYYNENEAQKSVGPQTSEVRASIKIPNNIILKGKGYETKNGALAVSDELVQTEDGEVGKLVKYHTGEDGQQYMVV